MTAAKIENNMITTETLREQKTRGSVFLTFFSGFNLRIGEKENMIWKRNEIGLVWARRQKDFCSHIFTKNLNYQSVIYINYQVMLFSEKG